jgi:hypothetical protein
MLKACVDSTSQLIDPVKRTAILRFELERKVHVFGRSAGDRLARANKSRFGAVKAPQTRREIRPAGLDLFDETGNSSPGRWKLTFRRLLARRIDGAPSLRRRL